MKYYAHIEFVPSMKVDDKSDADDKRLAWLEEVACAILNHTKEDCCLRVRHILEMLVEAKRVDLLPGKKGKYTPIDRLTGGAASKLRAAFDDYILINQIAIVRGSICVPTSKFIEKNIIKRTSVRDTRYLDLYYFIVNPDTLRDLYKNGTLPRSP